LADSADVLTRTVRLYERRGLLPPAEIRSIIELRDSGDRGLLGRVWRCALPAFGLFDSEVGARSERVAGGGENVLRGLEKILDAVDEFVVNLSSVAVPGDEAALPKARQVRRDVCLRESGGFDDVVDSAGAGAKVLEDAESVSISQPTEECPGQFEVVHGLASSSPGCRLVAASLVAPGQQPTPMKSTTEEQRHRRSCSGGAYAVEDDE
jgi:hypothetical protein